MHYIFSLIDPVQYGTHEQRDLYRIGKDISRQCGFKQIVHVDIRLRCVFA